MNKPQVSKPSKEKLMTLSAFAREIECPPSLLLDFIDRGRVISERNGTLVYANGRPRISLTAFMRRYGR